MVLQLQALRATRQHQAFVALQIDINQFSMLEVERTVHTPGMAEERIGLEEHTAQRPGTVEEHHYQHISRTPLL